MAKKQEAPLGEAARASIIRRRANQLFQSAADSLSNLVAASEQFSANAERRLQELNALNAERPGEDSSLEAPISRPGAR